MHFHSFLLSASGGKANFDITTSRRLIVEYYTQPVLLESVWLECFNKNKLGQGGDGTHDTK